MSAKNLSPLVRRKLLRWYDGNKTRPTLAAQRVIPTRFGSPETMLQQTQVKTALPYYDRFFAHFRPSKRWRARRCSGFCAFGPAWVITAAPKI